MSMKRRKISYAKSTYPRHAQSFNSSRVNAGTCTGTKSPPSGAYPEQTTSSNDETIEALRVDVYFMTVGLDQSVDSGEEMKILVCHAAMHEPLACDGLEFGFWIHPRIFRSRHYYGFQFRMH